MSASKDGKLWRCQFYYKDWQGVRRKKNKRGFRTKSEAEQWERDFLQQHSGDLSVKFAKDCGNDFSEELIEPLLRYGVNNRNDEVATMVTKIATKYTRSICLQPTVRSKMIHSGLNWQNKDVSLMLKMYCIS